MSSRCRPTGCASSTPSTGPVRHPYGSAAEGMAATAKKTRLADREGFLAWAFLLPSLVYLTALAAISWRRLLGSAGSPVDRLLREASLLHGGQSPLGRTSLAAASVVVVHVWRLTPLAAVIVMAGLTALPRGVWDAARLDGAGFWQRVRGVTIPLTLPVTALAAMSAS